MNSHSLIWGDNGSFGNILCSHQNLTIASNQVNLVENIHVGKVSREILYGRYWVPVVHCGIVEAPVVSARTL